MLESANEDYLIKQAKKHGLFLRKVAWIGRRGAPDRLLQNVFIELKKNPDEKPKPHQLREHERMRKAGNRVEVLSTKSEIDALINEFKK